MLALIFLKSCYYKSNKLIWLHNFEYFFKLMIESYSTIKSVALKLEMFLKKKLET